MNNSAQHNAILMELTDDFLNTTWLCMMLEQYVVFAENNGISLGNANGSFNAGPCMRYEFSVTYHYISDVGALKMVNSTEYVSKLVERYSYCGSVPNIGPNDVATMVLLLDNNICNITMCLSRECYDECCRRGLIDNKKNSVKVTPSGRAACAKTALFKIVNRRMCMLPLSMIDKINESPDVQFFLKTNYLIA